MPTKPDILVIGLGNPHRCDDGVGFFVIDELQHSGLQGVELMKLKADGYALLETWGDRKMVIIVDAAIGVGPVGVAKRFNARSERISAKLCPVSSHSISLAETISLAKTLGKMPDQLFIIVVEVSNLGHGNEISPKVLEAGKRVSKEIQNLIQSELANQS